MYKKHIYSSSKSGLETFSQTIKQELDKFNIKVATLRILYVPTKLSNKLNSQEIIILKNKFKTNKLGTVEKIFSKINKLHNLKKIPKNNLFFDNLRKNWEIFGSTWIFFGSTWTFFYFMVKTDLDTLYVTKHCD